MTKYNYIAYFGTNEIIINEQIKPIRHSEEFLYFFGPRLKLWQSSCKTIYIDNKLKNKIENYLLSNPSIWCKSINERLEDKFKEGVLLTNDIIKFENKCCGRCITNVDECGPENYIETAYFIEQENETQEDIIQDFMRKITGMTLPTEQLSEAKKLFTITRK